MVAKARDAPISLLMAASVLALAGVAVAYPFTPNRASTFYNK